MSNINQINGRSRKGHFWHCPKYLKKRCLQHYLGCNFQLKGNTEVHPPDVSAASQGVWHSSAEHTDFLWRCQSATALNLCHPGERVTAPVGHSPSGISLLGQLQNTGGGNAKSRSTTGLENLPNTASSLFFVGIVFVSPNSFC